MSSLTSNIRKKLADKLAKIAVQQIETSVRFKQKRMDEIKMNEDLYHGQSLPRLRGRFNVPLPTMAGYIDTLLSKIDEPPSLSFESDDPADFKATKKVTALAQKELKRRLLRWESKDINQKKMAAFSGVGLGEFYSESDPEYQNYYNIVDYYDFIFEPMGGCYLEDHSFCGRMNLFKSDNDLERGVEDGRYDGKQVEMLISASGKDDKKKNEEIFKNKIHRYQLMGLDNDTYNYLGQTVFPLTWIGMEYKGERYLLTLDYRTGIWVRAVKLKDEFESGLWPWSSWQTHPDEFIFLTKSPADDIRPVAIAIDIIFNQALDNRQKRNFGQRAYDPSVFPNPEDLEWRPDGLVRANSFNGIRQIAGGIYEFQTPEVSGTIDMIQFMDAYSGRKTGITDAAQGETEEKKVGIFFGELQQVADRIGLYNKSYSSYHGDIGLRLLWGMKEHLDEKTAVRLIGTAGVETEELLKKEIKPEWDINVEGGQAEARANEVKRQRRSESLKEIINNQNLAVKLNPDKTIRELLLNGEWTEEEVNQFLDTTDSANAELMGEADKAIQDIIDGKEPKQNRGATAAFIKHIVDYATDTTFSEEPNEDVEVFQKIVAYAESHFPIAEQNMVRKARQMKMQMAINMGNKVADGGTPAPMTPDGGEESIDPTVPPNPARQMANRAGGVASGALNL